MPRDSACIGACLVVLGEDRDCLQATTRESVMQGSQPFDHPSDKLLEFGRIEIVSDEHRLVGVPPMSQRGQSVSLSPKQTAIDQGSAQTSHGVELVRSGC